MIACALARPCSQADGADNASGQAHHHHAHQQQQQQQQLFSSPHISSCWAAGLPLPSMDSRSYLR